MYLRLSRASPKTAVRITPGSRYRAMSANKQPVATTTTTTTRLSLPRSNKTIDLVFPSSLHDLATLEQIQCFPPLTSWLRSLDSSYIDHGHQADKITVEKITIQSIDVFKSGKIGFLKFHATAYQRPSGTTVPGVVFLRGGSVAVLLILRTKLDDEEKKRPSHLDPDYAVMCVQPRLAAGELELMELPAGMVDGESGFCGVAAREIEEETGIRIGQGDLVELSPGVYPSPGACDELVGLYVCEKLVRPDEIEGIGGRLAGLRGDGEFIALRLVPLRELAALTRDMKTLAALHLWDVKNK
ncbi:hypothetical protein LPJ56_004287 [Coemansia sp. RSA 2599]|nr:hypothetical protein LPJ75_004106 [Coemansia sp. RSA 2598]KAJ1816475.1 hypothetical protein LPJ56_004287 [Coemansia sp. RSA 2599]